MAAFLFDDLFTVDENSTWYFNRSQNLTSPTTTTSFRPTWYLVLRGLLAFLTVLGNGLVIFVISSRRHLRVQASPYWFILSLAVADFFVGAFNGPTLFIYAFHKNKNPILWNGFEFLWNVFLVASSTNLCALTLDRYIAVLHPFMHSDFARSSRCAMLLAGAWVLSIVQRIPFLILEFQNASQDKYFSYQIFYIFTFVVLPNVFVLFAYIRITFVVIKHRSAIRSQEIHNTLAGLSTEQRAAERARTRHSLNGTISVGIVVAIFLVCNVFLLYWLTCRYLFTTSCRESKSTVSFFAVVILRYFNSVPNFIVYSLIKSDFRQEIRSLFHV